MALAADQNVRIVANDIRLPEKCRALVVTGPNAGGKTVVLKTLGLCCTMAQAGLPIPAAEGSRLGLHTCLAAVIGDSQDISRGLSTFSAHVERIGRILKSAGPGHWRAQSGRADISRRLPLSATLSGRHTHRRRRRRHCCGTEVERLKKAKGDNTAVDMSPTNLLLPSSAVATSGE